MFKRYGILMVLELWSKVKFGIEGMPVIDLGNAVQAGFS
jgi:hypothetical protein